MRGNKRGVTLYLNIIKNAKMEPSQIIDFNRGSYL